MLDVLRRRWLIAACAFAATAGPAVAGPKEDFFRAIELDIPATVSQVLAGGLNVNTLNEKNQHGLYLAMRNGSDRVAEVLLAAPGVAYDHANELGETPLMMAALHGRMAWCEKLIARGAAIQRTGWTPLHYGASGPEPKIVELLLSKGAHIDAPSANRTTPLMMAAGYGAEGNVDLLLKAGANPKLRNERDLTAADFARRGSRESLAARLEPLTRP